jgi:hypothetical protein
MKNAFLPVAVATMLATSAPVLADPSLGLGLSYVFGGGVSVGVRVFSTDRPQSGALALGLDYSFSSGALRPTVGAAYLDNDGYVDFSVGVDPDSGTLNYGIGLGGLSGMRSTTTVVPPPSRDT